VPTPSDARMALRLWDTAPVALCYLEGPDLALHAANPAALAALGIQGVPVGGWRAAGRVPGFDRGATAVLAQVLASGQEGRFMQRRPDGPGQALVVYEFLARPDLDLDGSVLGIFLSGRRLTVPGREDGEPFTGHRTPSGGGDGVGALQRELLPETTPIVPHVQVRAQCLAVSASAVGGDWFDAVSTPEGGLALVVGDVVGHGMPAAAIMGQLRAVAAHALATGASPQQAVDQLDLYAGRVPRARGSTAVVAAIDPASRTLRVAQRGHLPPLLITRDGTHRFAAVDPSAPLGLPGHTTSFVCHLSNDEIIVLYTDGLVTGIGSPIDAEMTRLGEAASAALRETAEGERLERLAAVLVKHASHRDSPPDDATVLVAKFSPQEPPALHVRAAATSDSLHEIRTRLTLWLEALGAGEDDIFALQHAATEAVAAVADQVHGPPARVDVRARLERDGIATVEVCDDVDWSAAIAAQHAHASPYDRPRGLILMLELVDDLQIETVKGGTVMRLRRRLGRPITFEAGSAEPARPAAGSGLDAFLRKEGDGKVLVVRGALGIDGVEELRLAVVAGSRGGTVLCIDLSGVTILSSAGVMLLHSLVSGGGVELRAVPGSPAHAAMTFAALPFTARGFSR
jgi:anti-sigma regulatory factor (Ser/Thr protein kinase)